MSASPRSASRRRAQGGVTARQARQQASDHCGLAIWVAPTRASARGREDPDGGRHHHPSSSQGDDSHQQP
jgi:hypothetical protein